MFCAGKLLERLDNTGGPHVKAGFAVFGQKIAREPRILPCTLPKKDVRTAQLNKDAYLLDYIAHSCRNTDNHSESH